MKQILFILLLVIANKSPAAWLEYSTRENGDVYFYDDSRIQKHQDQIQLWSRILYKTSLMGASSYQSQLALDCTERTEMVLQSTFFSDKNWTKPAMATNTTAKPKTAVTENSATEPLFAVLCKN